MRSKFFTFAVAALTAFLAPALTHAATGSNYPSLILQNQYGETYINKIKGGSAWNDCIFTVNSTDAGGNGVTSLGGAPCASVYMHTTATPSSGNPNPASGYIVVNLASQFYQYLNGYVQIISPPGTTYSVSSTGSTSGTGYIIEAVGTTTQANWQKLGMPAGLTPAVGIGFISTTTATVAGTGVIETAATSGSGLTMLELLTDPTYNVGGTNGPQILLRTLAPSSASVTTLTPTAPANSTIIKLHFQVKPLSTQFY